MGLDMYLYGSRFISSYDPLPEESVLVESVREGMDLPDCENPLSTFETKIIQWRKANAIHKWFVDNCQDGKDECQRTSLMLSDLHALRDTLAQLLDHDESKAALLLPPTTGFFFGSDALDEWYWDEVDRTHAVLGEWIKYIEKDRTRERSWGWDLFYDSSW
tara:strand:+ start:71 stop:553 length:483 start_codon:yes stop_codon:yes gene_type:complete